MKYILLLLTLFLSTSLAWAQPKEVIDTSTKTIIIGQLAIKTSPDEAWKAIKENYGHVGNHHKSIKYAYAIDEQMPLLDGAIRYSQLNSTQFLKESVTIYDEANKYYTTTIFESSENSLPMLHKTVGIKQTDGVTYVYHKIVYTYATRKEVGKIKKWNRAYLKAYKEVIEEMMPNRPKTKQFQQRLATMLYEEL